MADFGVTPDGFVLKPVDVILSESVERARSVFPDVDLTPYGGEEGGVSRRHARIFRQNGQYFVEDLHSTNYTKLDGDRLQPRTPEPLHNGARLDFGKVAMVFYD